ncbi:MAG: MarR family transcriptional regulator [Anaerolineae bacterium]
MNGKVCSPPETQHESGFIPEVFRLVDTVGKKLTQLQRETIRVAELTPAQYSLLNLLWEKDSLQFNELASACCCSPSTITGIVDTMEKNGLVARVPNPNDRRSLLVKLTERGRALENATPSLEKIFENCCGGMQPDELRRLVELLRKLDSTISA